MENVVQTVTKVNDSVNGFVWGMPMLIMLVGTGILMTLLTRAFQLTRFRYWMKHTIGGIFTNKHITAHTAKEDKSISQFQSLCTALAATIGTGNISGVAAAIATGGPGSVFWMWIVAIFGMMTNYSENVLGIYYRRKNKDGEWCGGAMYYLKDGLGSFPGYKRIGAVLAVLFSIFCVIASFGIGNMSQINSIAVNMQQAFSVPMWVTGVCLIVVAALVVVGGLKRIAAVTEKLVPFMALIYIIGTVVVVCMNASRIGPAFAIIFKCAFTGRAAFGGVVGATVKDAVTWGMKRGVFSNEAGLGSSVMVHSNSNVKEPVMQGMWGIFEVFADTIIVCSLTALTVLTSGLVDLDTGAMLTTTEKTAMVAEAFELSFGKFGAWFIAIAVLLFAFSTVLGWSHYGAKAFEYLFGTKATIGYKIAFVAFIIVGATMSLDLAWDLSDTFNGLMAIPNLIGVISLSSLVYRITANYIDRVIRGKKLEPMYSAFPEYQAQEEAEEAAK